MLRIIGRQHGFQILKECLNKFQGVPSVFQSSTESSFPNSIFPQSRQEQLVKLFDPNHHQSRFFSSQQRRKNKKADERTSHLINEKLVSFLINRFNSNARNIQVRLVFEESVVGEKKSSHAVVVSLLEAVEKSSELEVDLVGYNINQDIPTVKAQNFEKVIYLSEKKKEEKRYKQKPKNVKGFKFKAGIADHDFQRKICNIMEYLKKGHMCQIMLTAYGMRQGDSAGVETVMKKLQDSDIEKFSTLIKKSMNKKKSFASILLSPVVEEK